MNREIEFRGIRVDNGEWVYGSLLVDYAGTCQIWEKDETGAQHNYIVDKNTIGQYTGEKDINEIKIFEKDIVKNYNQDVMVVKYISPSFVADYFPLYHSEIIKAELKVIGNICENKNLLKRKK